MNQKIWTKIAANTLILILLSSYTFSQQNEGLEKALVAQAKEQSPVASKKLMDEIIKKYTLKEPDDNETIDGLKGAVAIAYAMQKNYTLMDKYLNAMRNGFNKTSYLNMATAKMLEKSVDNKMALQLAKRTITLYEKLRTDSSARPVDFPKPEWDRFINFAQYPYYDTYAQALYMEKDFAHALVYQEKAFDASPEEGITPSVERYAILLKQNNKWSELNDFLIKVAVLGKLTNTTTSLLKTVYLKNGRNPGEFDNYLDSLNLGAFSKLKENWKTKMTASPAPGFSLKDLDGHTVQLSDYIGHVVVIDLWATWCKPCIASFPVMTKIMKKHPEVIFLFIAVQETGENPGEKVKNFIQKNNYPFHVLMDAPLNDNHALSTIMSQYKPEGIPSKYVINKKGQLCFKTSGFNSDNELKNELEAQIMLAEEKS